MRRKKEKGDNEATVQLLSFKMKKRGREIAGLKVRKYLLERGRREKRNRKMKRIE